MPGISTLSPAPMEASVDWLPHQSVITTPLNPHSSRRTSCKSHAFSAQYLPFSLLYPHITAPAPPSATAASKGARKTSRSVRSSTTEFCVPRSVSWSLHAKCFAHAMAYFCTPRTYATPSLAANSGSSEKHSKWRPEFGKRCRFKQGPRSMSAPRRLHSAPSSSPTSCTSASSKVAARAVSQGASSAVSPRRERPRAPCGPSV
mmetsp:Transcript_103247/g.315935  ORF Transcript_103247/g.315935 Transcript_103247/m.315935 type:complete len:203 (-) Transcript_103247:144-752(-)